MLFTLLPTIQRNRNFSCVTGQHHVAALFTFNMNNGAKVISGAILGFDGQTVIINKKAYVIMPPTIAKMAGAAYYLSDLQTDGKDNIQNALKTMKDLPKAATALSWFIAGDDSLAADFMESKVEEVVAGLTTAFSMVSPINFTMLLDLVRNVLSLTAKPKLLETNA
jgi:hypothetical protein